MIRYVHDLPQNATTASIDQARIEGTRATINGIYVSVTYGTTVNGQYEPSSLFDAKELEISDVQTFADRDSGIDTAPDKVQDTMLGVQKGYTAFFDEKDKWHTI